MNFISYFLVLAFLHPCDEVTGTGFVGLSVAVTSGLNSPSSTVGSSGKLGSSLSFGTQRLRLLTTRRKHLLPSLI